MGSEDLFHKRKARKKADLQRKAAKRDSYDKVLLVCEGEKTEPYYFKGLKSFYELSTANILVDENEFTSPRGLFGRAEQLYKEELKKGDPYDRIYCIFDKDRGHGFDEVIRLIRSYRKNNLFFAAYSVPSFEYWYLLHFEYTTHPYAATGGNSVGDLVIKDLENYLPCYSKADKGMFQQLQNRLEFAKKNAAKSLDEAEGNQTDNPSTNIHELVEYLQNIKEEE